LWSGLTILAGISNQRGKLWVCCGAHQDFARLFSGLEATFGGNIEISRRLSSTRAFSV
jgi:hypothetical protein